MTSKQIRALIAKLGISKDEFAKRVGVDGRTVDGWFIGRKPSKPAVRVMEMLSK